MRRGFGERVGARTRDLLIKSQLLYQLSYALSNALRRKVAGPYKGPPEGSIRRPDYWKALKVGMVRVSRMLPIGCTFSVTKWPISASSGR